MKRQPIWGKFQVLCMEHIFSPYILNSNNFTRKVSHHALFSKKGFLEVRNSLLMHGKLTIPWQRPGQWTRVSSRCNLCPLDLGYHYPVLLNLKPAEPAPVCQLDASKTTLQSLSEVAAAPRVQTASGCVNSIIIIWKNVYLCSCVQ